MNQNRANIGCKHCEVTAEIDLGTREVHDFVHDIFALDGHPFEHDEVKIATCATCFDQYECNDLETAQELHALAHGHELVLLTL